MFSIIPLLGFLSIQLVLSQDATNTTECPENKTFDTCATPCPITCENWAHPPKSCPRGCRVGCVCPGTLLEDGDECVPKEECSRPPVCHQNETFQETGFTCATCRNYRYVRCPLQYTPRCYCNNGYVLNENLEACVLPHDCPKVSVYCQDVNEEYYECGPKCNETCQSLFEDEGVCNEKCYSGCYCRSGFIRNETSGACVPVRQCLRENV